MNELAPLLRVLSSTRPLRPLFGVLDAIGAQGVSSRQAPATLRRWLVAHRPHLPGSGALLAAALELEADAGELVKRAALELRAMPAASAHERRVLVRAALHLAGMLGGAIFAEPRVAVWWSHERGAFAQVALERRGRVVRLVAPDEALVFAALRAPCARRLASALPPRRWGAYPVGGERAQYVALLVPSDGGVVSTVGHAIELPGVAREQGESWRGAAVRAAAKVIRRPLDESELRWHCKHARRVPGSWTVPQLVARAPRTSPAGLCAGVHVARFPLCRPNAALAWSLLDAARTPDPSAELWAHICEEGILWVRQRATPTYDRDPPLASVEGLERILLTALERDVRRSVVQVSGWAPPYELWVAAMHDAGIERLAILEPRGRDTQGVFSEGDMAWCATWDVTEAEGFVRRESIAAPRMDRISDEERARSVFALVDTHEERRALAVLLHHLLGDDPIAQRGLHDVEVAVREIDARAARQLDELLHHPVFEALERAWRGLWHVVERASELCPDAKVEMLNVSQEDLLMDFEDSPEIPKSGLYKLVYSANYGSFGGRPYAAIFADYIIEPTAQDMALCQCCAAVAALAMSPFIVGAADALAGADEAVPRLRDLVESMDSRFLVWVGPRMLLRLPHDQRLSGSGMRYRESSEARVWGSPIGAMAGRLLHSWGKHRWGLHVDGDAVGGCLDGVTVFETAATASRCAEARSHGFALWRSGDLRDARAEIADAPTVHRRVIDDPAIASPHDAAGTRLAYVFLIGRFGQYLKILQREQIGTYKTPEALERFLGEWLALHVSARPDTRRQLKAAQVRVTVVDSVTGWFRLELRVTPRWWPDGEELTLIGKLDRD